MINKTYASLLFGIVAIAAWGPAFGAESDWLRESADRAEIQALMWRYVRGLDGLDPEGYASVFTADGQFGKGDNARKGRAALAGMIADLKKTRDERTAKDEPPSPPMHHVITNSSIEFTDADHARYYSYWMTVFGAAGQETPPRVAAAGRAIDELVRENGRWLIKFRDVAPE